MSSIGYQVATLTTENTAVAASGRVEEWLCQGRPKSWPHPRKGLGSADVHLAEDIYSKGGLNAVYGLRLGLIRVDLLEAFGASLFAEWFALGRVFGPSGDLIPDWKTYRGKRRIIIRGTKNVNWQRCEMCGAIQYSSWGGRDFLWPEPDPTVPIFDDNGLRLVFREDIANAIFKQRFSGVKLRKIDVARAPLDGLPELGEESEEYA